MEPDPENPSGTRMWHKDSQSSGGTRENQNSTSEVWMYNYSAIRPWKLSITVPGDLEVERCLTGTFVRMSSGTSQTLSGGSQSLMNVQHDFGWLGRILAWLKPVRDVSLGELRDFCETICTIRKSTESRIRTGCSLLFRAKSALVLSGSSDESLNRWLWYALCGGYLVDFDACELHSMKFEHRLRVVEARCRVSLDVTGYLLKWICKYLHVNWGPGARRVASIVDNARLNIAWEALVEASRDGIVFSKFRESVKGQKLLVDLYRTGAHSSEKLQNFCLALAMAQEGLSYSHTLKDKLDFSTRIQCYEVPAWRMYSELTANHGESVDHN